MKYIHYGHNEFDIKKFEKVENIPELTKAKGGFWGCRVNSDNGWKDWCESNDYEFDFDSFIIFSLKSDAKVLTIENHDQLIDLPKKDSILSMQIWSNIDFEILAKKYDAIEVLISKDHRLYFDLYGWDCDSIFVMNSDVIIQDNKKQD